MLCHKPFSILFLAALAPGVAGAQTVSNPQAVVMLTQSLAASGAAANPVQDFTATGTITYFWAGENVTGSATLRGRGADQFRLDATLPEGARSYAFSHGAGALKGTDGIVTPIPYHNTVNLSPLSFPYLGMAAAMANPLTTFSYVGLVTDVSGRQLNQVRLQKNFASAVDPDGSLARLCVTDYFLDPQTSLVAKTVDMTHPIEDLNRNYAHEVDLENYSATNGIQFPTLVREKVGGATIWEFHPTAVVINTGLTDQDFSLQ